MMEGQTFLWPALLTSPRGLSIIPSIPFWSKNCRPPSGAPRKWSCWMPHRRRCWGDLADDTGLTWLDILEWYWCEMICSRYTDMDGTYIYIYNCITIYIYICILYSVDCYIWEKGKNMHLQNSTYTTFSGTSLWSTCEPASNTHFRWTQQANIPSLKQPLFMVNLAHSSTSSCLNSGTAQRLVDWSRCDRCWVCNEEAQNLGLICPQRRSEKTSNLAWSHSPTTHWVQWFICMCTPYYIHICTFACVCMYVCMHVCMYINVYQCISMYINVYQCISMYINVYQCISMYINVYQCISMYINVYQCISLYIIVYHCISLYIIAYHWISLDIIAYHCISLYISV